MKRKGWIGSLRDPATRPRAVMWTGVGLIGLAIFIAIIGGTITSTRFFCAESCHMVQDDSIASYRNSSHSEVSCVTCHEPVNANPVVYFMAKAKSVIIELPETVIGAYHFPLNAGSAYALNPKEMGDKQCTQCHNENLRDVTPSEGIVINHAIHTKSGVTCTTCHNRCAHNEKDLTLKLEGNVKHADFTQMDACFRCHGLEGEHEAAGACIMCHSPEFDLVPPDHKEKGWLPKGHAEAAAESLKEFGMATAESEALIDEGIPERVTKPVEHCSTCHLKKFCDDCHERLAKGLAKKM